MTLFVSYKLLVLTRMVWSVCALAMGAVISKYRPTSFKNILVCLVTGVGCLAWFFIYILTVLGSELFWE